MTVRVDRDGAVVVITIDRPERRNAVDRTTATELSTAFHAFDADQSVTWYDIEMARDMHEAALQVANEKKIGWPLRPFL